ncbi:hypothetical protein [Streptomyces sp. NPDC055992]|uniref:hypothetical protein n=1 Tax=Streptomyces sp. NPDC055992 TaxID=3345673 RepID=UPI0035D6735A
MTGSHRHRPRSTGRRRHPGSRAADGAAELVADLHGSLARLLDEAAAMPSDRWPTLVTALAGWRHLAW